MAVFYVSPTGSDSASGTSETDAFKTLAKTQEAMRASAGADAAVIGGGTYTFTAPLTLTAADSNTTWAEAFGQTAIIDGGGDATSLVTINGASDITISGLGFTNTAGSGGESESSGAAIQLTGGSYVTISGSTFDNVAAGIRARENSHHLLIDGNTFTNTKGAAVDLNDGTHENTVSNNTMTNSGASYSDGAVVMLYESWGNTVSHNLINGAPRHGIEEQNWDPGNKSGGNLIEYNVIQHTMQRTNDGGAIYIYSGQDRTAPGGTTIRYNEIDDTGPNLSWGIYMDDYTNNAQIHGNLIQGARDGGVMLHGGDNNQVYDNVMLGSQSYGVQTMAITGEGSASERVMTGDNIYHNVIVAPSSGVIAGADQPEAGFYHDNVYVTPNGAQPQMGFDKESWNTWLSWDGDTGTDITSSAGFVNAAAGGYTFTAGSIALAQGIAQLPLASMGPASGGTVTPTPTSEPTSAPTSESASAPTPTQVPTETSTEVSIDTLVLQLSGDEYRGSPRFIVKVDGQQVGSSSTVTASHDDGERQTFTFTGDWAPGEHSIEIDFVNNHGGTGVSRDLWIDNVTYNGTDYGPASSVELQTNRQHFLVSVGQ